MRYMKMQRKWNMNQLVKVTPHIGAPSSYVAEFDDPALPYLVEVSVKADGGRMVCDRVQCIRRIAGPPVNGQGIRKVPLERLIRYALRDMPLIPVNDPKGTALKALDGRRLRRLGRLAPDEATWEAVANVYRVALFRGDPPAESVARSFGVPRSTAGKWIQKARANGFLGPTEERRAGEES